MRWTGPSPVIDGLRLGFIRVLRWVDKPRDRLGAIRLHRLVDSMRYLVI